MICCTPTTFTFVGEPETTVSYTGNRPIVEVIYLQPDGTMQQAGIFTHIEITPTQVIVTHADPLASGIIKLLQ